MVQAINAQRIVGGRASIALAPVARDVTERSRVGKEFLPIHDYLDAQSIRVTVPGLPVPLGSGIDEQLVPHRFRSGHHVESAGFIPS